jgi:hypothetical protein
MADKIQEIPETYLTSAETAHSEAIAAEAIDYFGADSQSIADIIISQRVKKEYQDNFGDTAKQDIKSQVYENLKSDHPEVVQALEQRIEAASRITQFYLPKYMDLRTYRPGADMIEVSKKPLVEQREAWNKAMERTQSIIRVVTQEVDARRRKTFTSISGAFYPALEAAIERKVVGDRDDMIYGDILSAVTAETEFRRMLLQNIDSLNKAANSISTDRAYSKQLTFNKNSAPISEEQK